MSGETGYFGMSTDTGQRFIRVTRDPRPLPSYVSLHVSFCSPSERAYRSPALAVCATSAPCLWCLYDTATAWTAANSISLYAFSQLESSVGAAARAGGKLGAWSMLGPCLVRARKGMSTLLVCGRVTSAARLRATETRASAQPRAPVPPAGVAAPAGSLLH